MGMTEGLDNKSNKIDTIAGLVVPAAGAFVIFLLLFLNNWNVVVSRF